MYIVPLCLRYSTQCIVLYCLSYQKKIYTVYNSAKTVSGKNNGSLFDVTFKFV